MRRLLALSISFSLASGSALAQWSELQLSTERAEHAATIVGELLLVGGGYEASGALLDTVDVFDLTNGTHAVTNMSVSRWNCVAGSVGNYAFFAGGRLSFATSHQVVDVYDASTGAWSTVMLSSGRRDLSVVTVRGQVLFAGGGPGGGAAPSATVDIYDSAVGPPSDPSAWSTAMLSMPRTSMGATVVGDYAIFAGGTQNGGATAVDRVDIYDAASGTWSTTTLSHRRRGIGATTVGQLALFAGGDDCCGFRPEVDVYDASVGPPTDPSAWSVMSLSTPRSTVAAATAGDLAIFAGGWQAGVGQAGSSAVVDVFDSTTGTWSTSSLGSARRLIAPAQRGDVAYFTGGAAPESARIDVYDSDFGARYCSPAVPNSTGTPASIHLSGRSSLALNELTLTARDLPQGSFGFFLGSLAQASVPTAGGAQGTLCLGGHVGRFDALVQSSGAVGVIAIPVDLTALPQPNGPLMAAVGETWNFQAWYRDANPGVTSNFSDAVGLALQ